VRRVDDKAFVVVARSLRTGEEPGWRLKKCSPALKQIPESFGKAVVVCLARVRCDNLKRARAHLDGHLLAVVLRAAGVERLVGG
jgi:hypothetical protein